MYYRRMIMNNKLAIALGLALVSGSVFAGGFSALDVDADGVVSKEEAAADASLASVFDQVDANGDGVISKAEYEAAAKGSE
jgi:Ca2+-binding EF-hand superfamily protein